MDLGKLRTEQDYIGELWGQLALPKLSETGSGAEALYQIYQTGVEYRMDNQILFTNQETEIYRLLYTFLDIAEDIVQKVPMDLMEIAKYEHSKRARQELQKKINEAWKTLGNLRKWSGMLGSIWIEVIREMSSNPEYATVTWEKLQDKDYMDEVQEKFINPIRKKRNILITNINRHTEKLLKMVREIYDELLDLDYVGPNKTRLQVGFQNLIDQTERYFQASIKHIKKIQEEAEKRKISVAHILFQTLSDQHMEREIAGLGKMPLYTMETPDGIITIRNYKNWLPMLHGLPKRMNWYAIDRSIGDLLAVDNEYLVPLAYMTRAMEPTFYNTTINFLSLMIMTYLTLGNSYNVDLTVYTSTKSMKTAGVGVHKAIRDYNIYPNAKYSKIIDEISSALKKPANKSLNKLFRAMVVVNEQNPIPGMIVSQTEAGAEDWYNNNKPTIDPLLTDQSLGPSVAFTVAKFFTRIIENMQLGTNSLMANYPAAKQEIIPNIKRGVQQGSGAVIHETTPLLTVLDPDLMMIPPEDHNECCNYEIKIPAGTKGVLYFDVGIWIAPCSEFVVQRYDAKNKTAKLVYKGSTMKNISKEEFFEMMRDYNKMHELTFKKEEQTVEEFNEDIQEFQRELYIKYNELIDNFIKRCRGQTGGRLSKPSGRGKQRKGRR